MAACSCLGSGSPLALYFSSSTEKRACTAESPSITPMRAAMNVSRIKRQIVDYTTLRNQGKITSAEYQTLTSTATSAQDPTTIDSSALTQLQNEATLRQYAAKNNITVTDAQVNDQIQLDATLPELRHVMVIGVQPTAVAPATVVTAADDAAAKTRIDRKST